MQIFLYLCTQNLKKRMISNSIDSCLVTSAAELLTTSQRVVVFTHMAPDGDAMGSSLAVYHWLLQARNWEPESGHVAVVVPNAFPSFLSWLPDSDRILVYESQSEKARQWIAEADLHVCLDFNEPKRIGPAGEQLLQNPCPKLLIDHHLNPSDFATVMISQPQASSTCELVYRLLWQMGCVRDNIPLNVATSLYTGLMTDTGNFSYNSNDPDIYEMIASLMRAGINKDAIYDAVFNQYTEDRVRLVGYGLYRKMQLVPEYHLAIITLSIEELQRFHYQQGDTEGLVNMPLQMSDIYYSVFLREQEPKPGTPKPVVKLSFRSQGDRPVNIFAHEVFGGGGHMNAAGGEFVGTLYQALQRLMNNYPKYLKKD